MIKKISLISAVVMVTSVWGIEIKGASHAVDVAGKQRMFTQRMLKDYAMVGMKNSFGNPLEDLKKIMAEFESASGALKAYTTDKEIQKSITKMEALWQPIQEVLSQEAKKEKVGKLQEDLEALLKVADDTTKLFSKASGKESGEVVNMAGRQRMLSQRMASLYMLKVWGIDDPQFGKKMDKAMDLFKSSLETLQKSQLNTEDINRLLTKVKRSFLFFEMMNKSKSKFIPTLIYKKSNDILVNMNSVTQAYVALETK
ncbi:MAG: type IV pili methyl-accepting chemotaxis transducer N-terminal domain-containing protein [Campylobacterota bacterium]|nr:type IV pili methyl-accepting chemotaxis transducer N-terminal domain-containing protein [Campylobacterota bacterium]